jgi:hypothetical protein
MQAVQEQVAASNGSAATTPVAKPIRVKPILQAKPITIAQPVLAKPIAIATNLSNGNLDLALKSAMTSAGGVDAGETTVTKRNGGSPERKGDPSEPEYEDYEDNEPETTDDKPSNLKWWLIGGIGGALLITAIVVIIIVAKRKK